MKFNPQQIKKISEVVALPSSMSEDSNYLSGQKLVDLFNNFGFGDDYQYPSVGIVTSDIGQNLSRQKYTFERIKKLEQAKKLPEFIQNFLDSIKEPLEAKKKIDEIISSYSTHIDMSAYDISYTVPLKTGMVPQPKHSISLLDNIKEDDIVVFISYAWDNEDHKKWVRKLSDDLRIRFSIYTLLDQYNSGGVNLIDFMRQGINLSHKVLVIGSPRYKEKVDGHIVGGVTFEDQILTIELYNGISEKHIPILHLGTFQSSFSDLMSVQSGYDFRDESLYEQHLKELAFDLRGTPLNAAPQLGSIKQNIPVSFQETTNFTDWKKIFNYSILKACELEKIYNIAIEKTCDYTLSISEFARLIFILCEIDSNGIKLTENTICSIKNSLYYRFDSAPTFDDLHDLEKLLSFRCIPQTYGIQQGDSSTLPWCYI